MSEAVVAQKGPLAVEPRAARSYVWCACGCGARCSLRDGSRAAL